MPFVDVIIYSFHYLLDPKVAEQVSKEFSKDCIVVFDEAHNIGTKIWLTKGCLLTGDIDNVCIESLSIDLTRPMLDAAARSVGRLGEKIDEYVPIPPFWLWTGTNFLTRIKATDASRLQEEYERLVEGLEEADNDRAEDAIMANPSELPASD